MYNKEGKQKRIEKEEELDPILELLRPTNSSQHPSSIVSSDVFFHNETY